MVENLEKNLENNITNVSAKAVDRLGEKTNDERLRDASKILMEKGDMDMEVKSIFRCLSLDRLRQTKM